MRREMGFVLPIRVNKSKKKMVLLNLNTYRNAHYHTLNYMKKEFKRIFLEWPYRSWASTVLTKEITWWKKEFISAYEAYGEVENEEAKLIGGGGPATAQLETLAGKIGNDL